MCSKGTFSLELGATKNRIELAEGLMKLGWEAELIGNETLGIQAAKHSDVAAFSLALRDYLILHAHKFDVVLYEYATLPYERSLFDKNTLFVARPAILGYRLLDTKYRYSFKAILAKMYRSAWNKLSGRDPKKGYAEKIDYCLQQCDLIQIQNTQDRALLIERGFDADKIVMIPNGITSERIEKFDAYPEKRKEPLTIVYVGTFDFRKGAMDFPGILKRVKKKFKDVKLKLLGTSGMFSTAAQVLNFFPVQYHASIEVVPKFNSSDLPLLLSDCHVGIFPSYLESFGYGALEMMCAGIPVVAYECPGPSDFILRDLLVPTGDHSALAKKVIYLLEREDDRASKGRQARALVTNQYCWQDISKDADSKYHWHIKRIREKGDDNYKALI